MLDPDSRLQWLPKTQKELREMCQSAPQDWQSQLLEHGFVEFSEPASVVPRVPGPTEKYLLQLYVDAFPSRHWVQHAGVAASDWVQPAESHESQAGAEPVPQARAAQNSEPAVPRKPELSSKPLVPCKREPGIPSSLGPGLEVARALLRNLPEVPISRSMLDYSQVLRQAICSADALLQDAWPQHAAIVNCGDIPTLTLQTQHQAPLKMAFSTLRSTGPAS